VLVVATVVAAAAAGCGGGKGKKVETGPKHGTAASGSQATRVSQTPYAAGSPEASAGSSMVPSTVGVRRTKLGRVLADGSGRTLYVFERDRGDRSACDRACAQIWPPLTTTTSAVPATKGISQRLLGGSKRSHRIDSVTYAGHPLYFYGFDDRPGTTRGQGVSDFGGRWWVIAPSGRVIRRR
jgi:predicted lipoprotein with Yx(FWY)xxD motif